MTIRRVLPLVVGALAACNDPASSTGTTGGPTETRPSSKPSSKPAPTNTVLRQNDPLPVELGGAVAPAPRPSASPPKAKGEEGKAGPPAAAAAEAAPVAEVHINHDHPADQPCKPLTEAEVKKAFEDMKGGG